MKTSLCISVASLLLGVTGILLAPLAEAAACVQPPTGCRISSHYGMRVHPVTKVTKLHAGTDFACPIGTPAKVTESGTVRSGWDDGGGNFVVITGTSGRSFKYFHLSRFEANTASMKPVSVGSVLAYTGNTGTWTTGPHLHFEAWVNGKSTNAENLLCGSSGSGSNPAAGVLDGLEDPTGDPALAPVGGPATPGGPPLAVGPPPAAPLGMDGSLVSLVSNIVSTRALNPDYPAQLATLPRERLYAELTYLDAASLRLQIEVQGAKERIEVMRALRQVLLTDQVLRPQLQTLRAAAAAR